MVRLALNPIGETGHWNLSELKAQLIELADEDIEIEDIGSTLAEFDQIILDDVEPVESGPLVPNVDAPTIARLGDVFVVEGTIVWSGGTPRTRRYIAPFLVASRHLVITGEPYSVPIAGHVNKGDHLVRDGERRDVVGTVRCFQRRMDR